MGLFILPYLQINSLKKGPIWKSDFIQLNVKIYIECLKPKSLHLQNSITETAQNAVKPCTAGFDIRSISLCI